jgi:hypothetical protein
MSWVGTILMSLSIMISSLVGGLADGYHNLPSLETVGLRPGTTTQVDDSSAKNWRSFDDATYDLHFSYPASGKLTEQQADAPSDVSVEDASYYTWYAIRVDIPVTATGTWQDNSFAVVIYARPAGDSCADIFPDVYQDGAQVTINGVTFYMTEDPGLQGGTYTVSKSKDYVAETSSRCYSFTELLRNDINASSSAIETNRDYSADFRLLDAIMETVKISG